MTESNHSEFYSALQCSSGTGQLLEEYQTVRNDLFVTRRDVIDLRRSAQLKRSSLSKSIDEMLQYINKNTKNDQLASGFKNRSENPFETRRCEIL